MSYNIKVDGGTSVRLTTAGKYCDRDIIVTAEGVDLPELSAQGTADDLMAGKQLIDGEGNIVDGAFTLDEEITTQDSLIAQIKGALRGKASGGNGSGLLTQEKSAEIINNGTHEILPDYGYALSKATVTVNVPIPDGYIKPNGTLEVIENGSYDVTEKAGVVVAVPEREIVLQNIEVTENGTYSAAAGFDGIGQVAVKVVASDGTGAIVEGIPDGYAKVDYIQFSGSESIDTGIICNQDTKIVVRYTRESSTAQYLYGVVNDGNTASVTAYLSSGGSWRFGSKSASRTISADTEIIRTAIVQKTGIVSDSGTNAYSGVTNFETPHTLILGGCHYSSGSVGTGFTGKVFSFEIWQGSELALKLVPVVNAEGEYRFWDKVGQKFVDTVQGVQLGGGNL